MPKITAIAMGAAALAMLASPALGSDGSHTMLSPADVEWRAGPDALPPGAEVALLYGNPGEEGLFAIRLRLPAGYHIPPHTHPTQEAVTILSGTFHLGMGPDADRDATRALEAGSFFAVPPGMTHYVYTDEETVVQIKTNGPWGIEYLRSEDDPRT